MSILRVLGLSALAMSLSAEAREAAPEAVRPVAIVYSFAGEASFAPHHSVRRPLRLFDRFPAGASLEVGPGSRLALAFMNGRRYELGEGSRVTLGAADLASRNGPVRSLPPVSPLPRLAPIAPDDHPGPKAGAVRIRSDRIEGIYPGRGATALASAAVLCFRNVAGAGRYWIEVEDGQGAVVYSQETASTKLSLPADALRPGVSYHWSVRTVDRSGPLARGEAEFATLDAETAQAREMLRLLAEKTGDGELTALLAGVDRELGLLAEARTEMRSALRAAPMDTALAEALIDLERHIEEAGFAAEN